MVTQISQKDPRWSSTLIGPSNVTIGGYGCTTCAMCMALEKLRGYFCNPKDAARHWTYNERGEILWYQTEWKGMEFVKRGYGEDADEIAEYANGEDTAVILSVNNSSHWVYCDKAIITANWTAYSIIDPIDGLHWEKMSSISYEVAGYALFKKKEVVSDWAKESWDWAKEEGYLNGERPQDSVTREELSVILKRYHEKN